MNIVIDTNILIASLVQHGIVREILLENPTAFVTPESCIDEAWEHRSRWNKAGIPDARLRENLDFLTDVAVIVASRDVYREEELRATDMTRDPDDVPVIALALSVDNAGIWTFNTKDFSGTELLKVVRVLGTGEVKIILREQPGE